MLTEVLKRHWRAIMHKPDQVCPAWRVSFEAFATDMGDPPSARAYVRRPDLLNPWGPGNCEWQARPLAAREPMRVKPDEIPFLIEMVEQGAKVADVAKAFGVTATAVRSLLSRRSISARHASGAKGPRTKITTQDAEAIRRDYATRARTVAAMAKDYGVSPRAVYDVLNEYTWKRQV